MKLPRLTGELLIKILIRNGFEIKRRKGGHVQLEDNAGRRVTVPLHQGKEIGRGLRKIMRDVEMSKDELIALLSEI